MMTFEDAEKQLTSAQKADIARMVLYGSDIGRPLTEPERDFCFGLSVYCEYEQRCEVERYLAP
jgi:hypothetical protein